MEIIRELLVKGNIGSKPIRVRFWPSNLVVMFGFTKLCNTGLSLKSKGVKIWVH